jgi:hypothetical protein
VVDRSGKSRLPRVRECRHRQCIEPPFEGSTVVGKEALTERRGGTGQRDGSRQEECSHHRRCHIADPDEERGAGRAA